MVDQNEGKARKWLDEDALRLVLLYFYYVRLYKLSPSNYIDNNLLYLIWHFYEFYQISYGDKVFHRTIECLYIDLVKKLKRYQDLVSQGAKNTLPNIYLLGFIYGFQVWIYETIPITTTFYIYHYSHIIPRFRN